MRSSKQRLKQKLARLNPDRDCVAIFQPNQGIVFYIPDYFTDQIKAGNDQLPAYVMAVLMHAHLLQYFDTDPVVKEFYGKIRDQVLLDLQADNLPAT